MKYNVSAVSAVAILALGMTTTAFGQSPIADSQGNVTNCPQKLGDLYPGLPAEVKDASAAGTKACVDTVDARLAALKRFVYAGEALTSTIVNEKSSVLDVLKAKYEYVDASALYTADRPMHTLNLAATMKYFDWVIERGKSNLPLDMVGLQVFDTWQNQVFAIEKHPGPDKGLMEQSRLALADRVARESAENKRIIQTMDDMIKLDRDGMKLLDPENVLACADGSKPTDGLCVDGSEPAVVKRKK